MQGGIGPIPFSELVAYMDAFRVIDLDERDRFIRMIKAQDRVYVRHASDKLRQDRERARKSAKSGSKRRPR